MLCRCLESSLNVRAAICIGYRPRWRSDIWRTDRGVAEVRSPDIRPATEDDIRHNAPGLLETVDQLLRTKVRRKLLNQDKPARLASYSTVGCRRTGGRRSQPGSFLFFTTSANLVLIFQSVFESRRLACSAQTVCDDACWAGNAAETFQTVEVESFRSQQCRRRSRLHSKRSLRVVNRS